MRPDVDALLAALCAGARDGPDALDPLLDELARAVQPPPRGAEARLAVAEAVAAAARARGGLPGGDTGAALWRVVFGALGEYEAVAASAEQRERWTALLAAVADGGLAGLGTRPDFVELATALVRALLRCYAETLGAAALLDVERAAAAGTRGLDRAVEKTDAADDLAGVLAAAGASATKRVLVTVVLREGGAPLCARVGAELCQTLRATHGDRHGGVARAMRAAAGLLPVLGPYMGDLGGLCAGLLLGEDAVALQAVDLALALAAHDPYGRGVLACVSSGLDAPRAEVRAALVAGLWRTLGARMPDAVLDAVATRLSDVDPAVRAAAVRAIGRAAEAGGGEGHVPALQARLRDKSAVVRAAALTGLARVAGAWAETREREAAALCPELFRAALCERVLGMARVVAGTFVRAPDEHAVLQRLRVFARALVPGQERGLAAWAAIGARTRAAFGAGDAAAIRNTLGEMGETLAGLVGNPEARAVAGAGTPGALARVLRELRAARGRDAALVALYLTPFPFTPPVVSGLLAGALAGPGEGTGELRALNAVAAGDSGVLPYRDYATLVGRALDVLGGDGPAARATAAEYLAVMGRVPLEAPQLGDSTVRVLAGLCACDSVEVARCAARLLVREDRAGAEASGPGLCAALGVLEREGAGTARGHAALAAVSCLAGGAAFEACAEKALSLVGAALLAAGDDALAFGAALKTLVAVARRRAGVVEQREEAQAVAETVLAAVARQLAGYRQAGACGLIPTAGGCERACFKALCALVGDPVLERRVRPDAVVLLAAMLLGTEDDAAHRALVHRLAEQLLRRGAPPKYIGLLALVRPGREREPWGEDALLAAGRRWRAAAAAGGEDAVELSSLAPEFGVYAVAVAYAGLAWDADELAAGGRAGRGAACVSPANQRLASSLAASTRAFLGLCETDAAACAVKHAVQRCRLLAVVGAAAPPAVWLSVVDVMQYHAVLFGRAHALAATPGTPGRTPSLGGDAGGTVLFPKSFLAPAPPDAYRGWAGNYALCRATAPREPPAAHTAHTTPATPRKRSPR